MCATATPGRSAPDQGLRAGRTRAGECSGGILAHIRTTPKLWAGLRELVFGSLDGSADLSGLGFAPVEGHVPVFGRVSDVLALPASPWTAPREGLPPRLSWRGRLVRARSARSAGEARGLRSMRRQSVAGDKRNLGRCARTPQRPSRCAAQEAAAVAAALSLAQLAPEYDGHGGPAPSRCRGSGAARSTRAGGARGGGARIPAGGRRCDGADADS